MVKKTITLAQYRAMQEKPKQRHQTQKQSSINKDRLAVTIHEIGKHLDIEIATEYKFHDKRKWRFDWAIPSLKIAIEYEGLFSAKSRHTTPTGFTNDCTKYNNAAANGWAVLRFTSLNEIEAKEIIEKTISIKSIKK